MPKSALAKIIQASNDTVATIASDTGLSRQTIYNAIDAKFCPRLDIAYTLADYFKRPVTELFPPAQIKAQSHL